MRWFIKQMDLFILEGEKIQRNLNLGWGNGYVILDKNHPWYRIGYKEIPVEVHGGLAYGAVIDKGMIHAWKEDLSEEDEGKYLIGFNTAHYGDNQDNCNREYVEEQAVELFYQCFNKYLEDV